MKGWERGRVGSTSHRCHWRNLADCGSIDIDASLGVGEVCLGVGQTCNIQSHSIFKKILEIV